MITADPRFLLLAAAAIPLVIAARAHRRAGAFAAMRPLLTLGRLA